MVRYSFVPGEPRRYHAMLKHNAQTTEAWILSDDEHEVDDAILEKRWVGALAFLFGGIATNIGYLSPLVAIENDAENVSLSITAAAIAPVLLIAGLFSLVLGPRYTAILGTRSAPTKMGIALYGILMLLGFIGAFAMNRHISMSGFE